MRRFNSTSHRMITATAWKPDLPADQVNDHIWTSAGVTDSHLVTTPDGDVVINTGFHYQAKRHRERYEEALGRPLDVRKIVFTQSYPEQTGGWGAFAAPGVETIAQANYPDNRVDHQQVMEFLAPRNKHLFGGISDEQQAWFDSREIEPEVTTLFGDAYSFEVGGRRFELLSVPGGEATDCVAVWLPDERTVFTGNLDGALYGQIPHLYTIRGDRLRSARLFIRSFKRVIDLEPELLITGHDAPIFGAKRIRADMQKVLDAVCYIHDETVAGMNQGKDLWTLMAEIRLPEALEPAPGRGPVWWYVRSVWEEYSGWFRFESTTELYAVPPRAIWGQLAGLVGGPDVLAECASRHAKEGDPLRAIHFTDIALSVDANHRLSIEARHHALELLLEQAGDNFDELRYLEVELERSRAALSGESQRDKPPERSA
jgi:glyoxylase-like metal-dependent hydrolase (beta-lactamase superfamily II)